MVALSAMGSAILLFSCGTASGESDVANNETLMTERSEHLTILMSENGRRSYHFTTPLLEGYTLASDPYREFRKGIHITTYQNDSLTTVNATLVANYAIFYEERELWEAKGDVVVEKADGTKLYTQQLFWNSKTGRIYSNVDSKIVKGSDVFMGEGFESDEELKEWRFRRMSGKMLVNMEPTENPDSVATTSTPDKKSTEADTESAKPTTKSGSQSAKSGRSSSAKRESLHGKGATPASTPTLSEDAPRKVSRRTNTGNALHSGGKQVRPNVTVPNRKLKKGGERLLMQQAQPAALVDEKTE